jgi:hypothetical protein
MGNGGSEVPTRPTRVQRIPQTTQEDRQHSIHITSYKRNSVSVSEGIHSLEKVTIERYKCKEMTDYTYLLFGSLLPFPAFLSWEISCHMH